MFPAVRKETFRLLEFILFKIPSAKSKRKIFSTFRQILIFVASHRKCIYKHLALLPVVLKVFNQPQETSKTDMNSILMEADTHLRNDEAKQAYQLLLPYKDTSDIEILWRLAAAIYDICEAPGTDSSTRKTLAAEGYHLILKALTLNNSHPEVNRTMALLTDVYFKEKGIRSRIAHCVEVKEFMLKAEQLKPDDCLTLYMIAHWNFAVAELPWMHKQIMKLFHGSLMNATYEEAFQYFEKSLEREKANDIKTKFFVMNIVMVGLCYQIFGNKKLAIKYYQEALEYSPRQRRDKEALDKAKKLLTELGQVVP